MTDVLMPALSPTMTEGKLARWLVSEGQAVKPGAVLAEIETDKATMEVEAVDEGILQKIFVAAGTESVQVNTVIAQVLRPGEKASDSASQPAASAAPVTASVPAAPMRALQIDSTPEIPDGTPFKKQTVREALRDAMAEEMRRDEEVFLMGEEVAQYQGAYKVSQGLLDEFGARRVIDTPITEHGFAGLAVGAAFAGLRPIVEFMTFNFALQAMDQILNSAAKTLYMSGGQLGCPIVFRGPNGAASRVGAQHSQDFSAWFAQIPGLKVVAPYSADDAKGLLKAAIRDPNPVLVLENEILYGRSFDVPQIDHVVPIGKARIRRKGADVTIVAHSIAVGLALEAAQALEQEGIDAEVIDLRSLRPIDYDTVIRSVIKTNRCVTVEEGWPTCSIGSQIAAEVGRHAFDHLDAPIVSVTGRDIPMPYAAALEKLTLPSAADVITAVKTVTYRL